MKEYIEKSKIIETLENQKNKFAFVIADILIDAINETESVDAEPVRHGKWIDIDEQSYTWKVRCSYCGNERSMMSTQGTYPNYCETCGSKMDERKEE